MKKHFTSFLLSVLVASLLVAHLFTEIAILTIVAFLLVCLFIIFSKTNTNILCILFFLVSFNVVFKTNPSSVSLFSVLELISIAKFAFKRKSINTKTILLSALLFIYMVIADVFSEQFGVNEYVRQIVNIFILYFVVCEFRQQDCSSLIILFYSFGVVASSLIAIFANNIPHFYDYIRHVGLNSLILNRFSGMSGDPNYYSINVNISILGLMYLYSKNRISFILWPLYFALSYFGLMTLSKSFVIVWILVSLFFVFLLIKNKKTKSLWFYSFVVLFGLSILSSGRIGYFNTIISRLTLTSGNANELTSGRVNLWVSYLDALFDGPRFVFGFGINAPDVNGRDVHNYLIELLFYFGFVGLIIYSACYFSVLQDKKWSGKISVTDYSGFILLLAMYFFLQMVHFNELPFHLSIAFFIMQINRTNSNREGNNFIDARINKKTLYKIESI